MRPLRRGTWRGLPVTLAGDSPFWKGAPYTLTSLLFGGPLVTAGGLALTWFLYTSNFPRDQEVNVFVVLPVFLVSIWGLPWGCIYLFSVLVTNCLGGQDVTEEIEALVQQGEPIAEPVAESSPLGGDWGDGSEPATNQEPFAWKDKGTWTP